MDAISAVEARIGSIEARFAALAPTPATATPPDDFAAVLAAATSRTTGTAVSAGAAGLAPGAVLGTSTVGLAGWAAPPVGGQLTAANRLAPGDYPRLTPPPELAAYGNGRVPSSALQPIDAAGTHRLWGPAAAAFTALQGDAARAGVQIGVTDSYRPLAVQERLAREKGLYSEGGLAARPGTSNHGWGLALDLDLDGEAQAWMRENGWRYGFVEDVPREPWHWTYRPAGNGS